MTYTLWPLRFSANPAGMIDFCADLGLRQTDRDPAGTYASFAGSSGRLGIHDSATSTAGAPGRTVLNLMTADVDAAATELRDAGFEVGVRAEPYGRQGWITTPSGLVIGLNELDPASPEYHEQTVAASMTVVAICTVADVAAEQDLLSRFGFRAIETGEGYLPLVAGPDAGVIGLRAGEAATAGAGTAYPVLLGAETSEPLDALAERMRAAGHPAETITDDTGVRVRITDPDGAILEVRPTR